MTQSSRKAREVYMLPKIDKFLLSVSELTDKSYTTILSSNDGSITIHQQGAMDQVAWKSNLQAMPFSKGGEMWVNCGMFQFKRKLLI